MKDDIGYIEEKTYNGGTRIAVYSKTVPNHAAAMAKEFVERWGMVAGQPDGEDSSGRAKIRLATPKEMVDRAVETAELLLDTFEKKGWILSIPAPKPGKPLGDAPDVGSDSPTP